MKEEGQTRFPEAGWADTGSDLFLHLMISAVSTVNRRKLA